MAIKSGDLIKSSDIVLSDMNIYKASNSGMGILPKGWTYGSFGLMVGYCTKESGSDIEFYVDPIDSAFASACNYGILQTQEYGYTYPLRSTYLQDGDTMVFNEYAVQSTQWWQNYYIAIMPFFRQHSDAPFIEPTQGYAIQEKNFYQGSIECPLSSVAHSSYYMTARKTIHLGAVGFRQLYVDTAVTSGWTTIGTIPQGFHPNGIYYGAAGSEAHYGYPVRVRVDGLIDVYKLPANTKITGFVLYLRA